MINLKSPQFTNNLDNYIDNSQAKLNQNMYESLCKKESTIALVGLGYVGLPIALEFAKHFNVIGFDINESRINQMRNKIDPSGELHSSDFENKNIIYSSCPSSLKDSDLIVVAVPTPVSKNNAPNLSPLSSACEAIGKNLEKGNIVVFESTVYPGCTEEVCIPILEKESGLIYNQDFFVGYSPERINPGDKVHTLTKIKKIVSGSNVYAEREIYKIYDHIIEAGIHLAPSMKVAEAAKIIENTQRDVNIALMNELSTLFSKLDINTHEVLEAAGTKWNFLNFYPGLVGGHCIGVDPYYLIHKANSINLDINVIKSSRKINDSMPEEVVQLVADKLLNQGKDIKDAKVLILGSTFKEDVTDLRNSKAAEMSQHFVRTAHSVDIIDPLADNKEMLAYYNLNLASKIGDNYDAIVYAVNHKQFENITWDFIESIVSKKSVVFDFKKTLGKPSTTAENITYITL